MAGAKTAGPTKRKVAAKAKRTARVAKAPAARAPRARSDTRATSPASRSNGRTSTATAGTIDKLHQVALKATDLDASVAFYRDTLGLRFIARFDPPGLAFFNLGGIRLLLSATESAATLYFIVDDLKDAYRSFQKRGVHFLQPPAMIHRDQAGQFGRKGMEEWMAFFKDPSDNVLALVERK
jgi:methylmalonyl-CoA/ethylmalonyl-CoA epimerase